MVEKFFALLPALKAYPQPFITATVSAFAFGWAGAMLFSRRENSILRSMAEAYKARLDGASPEQAGQKIADLQAQVAALSPTRLTPDQASQLQQMLRRLGTGAALILLTDPGSERRMFAKDMVKAFRKAGWHVDEKPLVSEQSAPSGLFLDVQRPAALSQDEEEFARFLKRAGIEFDVRDWAAPAYDGLYRLRLTVSDPAG